MPQEKNNKKRKETLVAILMGSDSDLPILKPALEFLRSMEVSYDIKVLSAHRTPEEAATYAKNAEANGVKVFIAAAGGAAHLPGVIAAFTQLPVIGVPIESKSLKGLDSLLSIAQMPSGIPVATMAIDGGKNAAIFACRILALSYASVHKKLGEFKEKMRRDVLAKNAALEEQLA